MGWMRCTVLLIILFAAAGTTVYGQQRVAPSAGYFKNYRSNKHSTGVHGYLFTTHNNLFRTGNTYVEREAHIAADSYICANRLMAPRNQTDLTDPAFISRFRLQLLYPHHKFW
jgi:hypothetical protein